MKSMNNIYGVQMNDEDEIPSEMLCSTEDTDEKLRVILPYVINMIARKRAMFGISPLKKSKVIRLPVTLNRIA